MIERITHPYPAALLQARIDQAILTGKPMVERPFHYRNTGTGQLYYDLYAGLGWPSEITDKDAGMPGYIGIVGVIKDNRRPEDARFQLLAELESKDVPDLIRKFLAIRGEYGFGLYPGLMQSLIGDAERFITTMALVNERLIEAGGEKAAVLVTPPDDFYDPLAFDIYGRSLRTCLMEGAIRLFFGDNEVLKTRLREFRKGDPAVMGLGGLIHSLVLRCTWLDQTRENAFVVEEGYAA